MTIHDIINKVASMNPYKVPGDRDSYSQHREGWQDALGQLEVEVESAVVSDSEWLSPNDEERAMQVSKLKDLFPSYPAGGVKWQYMNDLLEMAEHSLDEVWILKRAGEITEHHLTQNVIKVGRTVEKDEE